MPPTALLLVELGAVILGLAILARLAGRLGFSAIPLYLLAGLAFGEGGVLPLVTTEEFIEVGASIGVVLLLLLLGLEYTAEQLTSSLRTSAVPAVLNLVLNFTPGFAAGLLLGWQPMAAVILGGVTYVTSSGIVSRLLEELEWTGNREVPVVLSLMVSDDLAMAVYLPLVAVGLRGGDVGSAAISVTLAVATVALIMLFAFRWGPVASRLVFSRSDEVLLLSIFGLVLLVAGVAESLRVSAAVGAFLMGIALSGPAADRARALLTPLRDLFAAVFFVFFGLQLDPRMIPPMLGAAAVLALATAATKMITGVWSARMAGIGVRGRFRAGALLVPRGEFSIALAALGVASGVEGALGPLAAAYVLLLAIAGPILIRGIDPLVVAVMHRGSPPRSLRG